MINQLWGPIVDLVRDGGYAAWTVGDWLTLKYANLILFAIVAVLFVGGMLIDVPHRGGSSQ